MPLFAHWRHTPYAQKALVSLSGDRKGAPNTSSSYTFCSFDTNIEEKLVKLHHAAQRLSYNDGAQAEIDTYLVACMSPKLRHIIIPRNNVPHYDNLPDISAYAIGIIDPGMDGTPELQQVLLLLRQCTPLRRRTKRAQREVLWREESTFGMQTLLRCMQGTLLGLYPNCLKTIAFLARMQLLRFLRTVLVQPFAKMHACMHRIPYIIKLCVMEHLCNTIYDYHPGICHTLNRSGQKVEHFCNSVTTICDVFRGELNSAFTETQDVLEILPRMERVAHSYFERCTRAYRGIIIGRPPPIRMEPLPACDADMVRRIIDVSHVTCSKNVFEATHCGILSPEHRELAWQLLQSIQVHALPSIIAGRQTDALHRRYNGDTACIEASSKLNICIRCVALHGSAAHGTRLRHDCLTGELVCMHCGFGTVLSINIIGRLVHVAKKEQLLLSSCCGNVIRYSGIEYDGSKCGPHCASGKQLFGKKERTTAATTTTTVPKSCFICGQRCGVQQTLRLLDPRLRCIVPHGLCSKHVVPRHIVGTIFDKETLLLYFQQRQSKRSRC
jgi:hypothetical protein